MIGEGESRGVRCTRRVRVQRRQHQQQLKRESFSYETAGSVLKSSDRYEYALKCGFYFNRLLLDDYYCSPARAPPLRPRRTPPTPLAVFQQSTSARGLPAVYILPPSTPSCHHFAYYPSASAGSFLARDHGLLHNFCQDLFRVRVLSLFCVFRRSIPGPPLPSFAPRFPGFFAAAT